MPARDAREVFPRRHFLITLLPVLLVACVGPSPGDLERRCAMLDDPDPARRARALDSLQGLSNWRYASEEALAAPSLTPCVIRTARLVASADPRESLNAALALQEVLMRLGARAPETVVPILLRTAARHWDQMRGVPPAQELPDSTISRVVSLLGDYGPAASSALPLLAEILADEALRERDALDEQRGPFRENYSTASILLGAALRSRRLINGYTTL